MSDKTKAHLSAKTLWVLFILGLVNAVMYCFPYIRLDMRRYMGVVEY